MISFDPERAYSQLLKAGEDWADKDSAANLLEETRRSLLAELMRESGEKSVAAQETVGLSSSVYREHICAMVEARKQANIAKVRYDTLRVLAELRRSQEATRRAEVAMVK